MNLIVDQYLSFAELQAQRRKSMHMADWVSKLHDFLTLNDREILTHAGKVTRDLADLLAGEQYERFDAQRRAFAATHDVSDFDEQVRQIEATRKTPRKKEGR